MNIEKKKKLKKLGVLISQERKNKDLTQTKKNNILTLNIELKPNTKNVLVLDKVIE